MQQILQGVIKREPAVVEEDPVVASFELELSDGTRAEVFLETSIWQQQPSLFKTGNRLYVRGEAFVHSLNLAADQVWV